MQGRQVFEGRYKIVEIADSSHEKKIILNDGS